MRGLNLYQMRMPIPNLPKRVGYSEFFTYEDGRNVAMLEGKCVFCEQEQPVMHLMGEIICPSCYIVFSEPALGNA